jgi:hypothetical protein
MSIDTIRSMRRRLNENLTAVKALVVIGCGGILELYKVYNELRLARMWMGKVLGELGTEYPYPNSTKPENDVIDRAADTGRTGVEVVPVLSIAWVKQERLEVQEYVNAWSRFMEELYVDIDTKPMMFMCVEQTLVHLMTAKMWLGVVLEELGKMREEAKQLTIDNMEGQ